MRDAQTDVVGGGGGVWRGGGAEYGEGEGVNMIAYRMLLHAFEQMLL